MIKQTFLSLLLLISLGYSQGQSPFLNFAGDTTDIDTETRLGIALIGNGGNVQSAFQWMIDRSGGGNAVVITASGNGNYTKDLFDMGGLQSVVTLNITSREEANDEQVARTIRNAELLFIAEGDQSRYMNYWKNTKSAAAINYVLNEKKVPVGGTSAGCAILGGICYSGEEGSAVSDNALQNPFHPRITLYNNDLMRVPWLANVITDPPHATPDSQGRHIAFLARAVADWGMDARGIAPGERTAVCIDENGVARVYGENKAYFVIANSKPEKPGKGGPLDWSEKPANYVYEIQGTDSGAGKFSVANFTRETARGGKWYRWNVTNGKMSRQPTTDVPVKYAMVIHGGAGTILRKNMTAEAEKQYVAALTQALEIGYKKIKEGKSSLDAVEAAIHVLEDNPLFNAGKGAVFTHEGRNELDASIMDGKTLMAGAVAGVTNIRNPISAARAVMEKSEHVMMAGSGAEKFAKEAGLTIVDPEYFYTKSRWEGLQRAIKEEKEKSTLDHNSYVPKMGTVNKDDKFGTVGAVALDQHGNLAAGTSTGGMTNKKFGRIGDSPIIGAGTYANNYTVAVSCTGWGEFYIRNVVAYDLSALMEYKGLPVSEAGRRVIEKVGAAGGDGGLIALDSYGNAAMPFNTEGMYRGTVTADGKITVEIYKD